MGIIEWDESLSVKIKSIDDQHKILIGMINDFYEKLKDKPNSKLIPKLIRKMSNYVIEHFNFEEELFEKFKYSQSDAHTKEHHIFIEKVNELQKKHSTGKMILTDDVSSFLQNWFKNHILKSDMKYVDLMLRNGVK